MVGGNCHQDFIADPRSLILATRHDAQKEPGPTGDPGEDPAVRDAWARGQHDDQSDARRGLYCILYNTVRGLGSLRCAFWIV